MNNSGSLLPQKDCLPYITDNFEAARALTKLHLDRKSWQGAEKKEIQLKLKECSSFLEDCNISSPNHILIPFIKNFFNEMKSFDEECLLQDLIAKSVKTSDEIKKCNGSLERNLKFHQKLLHNMAMSNLGSELECISLENNFTAPNQELSSLVCERITELLDKIEKQLKEIEVLHAKKNELSP